MINRLAAGAFLLILSAQASGQCMRTVPQPPPRLPEPDGIGAFGPLNNTLTLDCLRFLRTESTKRGPVAVVVDEKGTTFRLRPGDRVGENDGRISVISPTRITITQLVKDSNGDWLEVSRYLFVDTRK